MKKDNKCFYKDIEIRFYDCDSKKRARLETIMRYIADIAGIDYTSKGYSHSWLWENGFVFLLSRVSIHINRMPVADEALTMETWERGVKGALFYRDVVFYDKQDNAIVESTTAWVLVNPNTRTILKPSVFTGNIPKYEDKKVNCLPASRLKFKEELDSVGKRRIVYSDIDGNNHVYNAVYSAIACDFLPQELMEKDIKDFIINFKREAVYGDDIEMMTKITDNSSIVQGEVGKEISFQCKFEFK